MKKRILSMILCIVMFVGLLPATVITISAETGNSITGGSFASTAGMWNSAGTMTKNLIPTPTLPSLNNGDGKDKTAWKNNWNNVMVPAGWGSHGISGDDDALQVFAHTTLDGEATFAIRPVDGGGVGSDACLGDMTTKWVNGGYTYTVRRTGISYTVKLDSTAVSLANGGNLTTSAKAEFYRQKSCEYIIGITIEFYNAEGTVLSAEGATPSHSSDLYYNLVDTEGVYYSWDAVSGKEDGYLSRYVSKVKVPAGTAYIRYWFANWGTGNDRKAVKNMTVVLTNTSDHTHSWNSDWSYDDSYHWHECTVDGCAVTENSGKNGYAAHSYTNNICSCGRIKHNSTGNITVAKGQSAVLDGGTVSGTITANGSLHLYGNAKVNEEGTGPDIILNNGGSIRAQDKNGENAYSGDPLTIEVDSSFEVGDTIVYGSTDTDKFIIANDGLTLMSDDANLMLAEAPAASAHTHPECGDSDCAEHGTEITYQALTFTSGILHVEGSSDVVGEGGGHMSKDYTLPAGNYYLAENIVLDGNIRIAEEAKVHLCLNGKTLSSAVGGNVISITASASRIGNLIVCDCLGGGTVDGGEDSTVHSSGDTLTVYGGTFTSNCSWETAYIYGADIYGGSFINTGSGIALDNFMYDVNIYDGTFTTESGSVLDVDNLTVYGGTFTNNSATNATVFIDDDDVPATFYGGTFTNNGGGMAMNNTTATASEQFLAEGYEYVLPAGKTINNTSTFSVAKAAGTITYPDCYATVGGGEKQYSPYGLFIAGIPVTEENKDSITGAGILGSVSYDPATKTLTLNNADISVTTDDTNAILAMYQEDEGTNTFSEGAIAIAVLGEDVTILYKGTNAVTASYTGADLDRNAIGIYCVGANIVIEGEANATLNMTPEGAAVSVVRGNFTVAGEKTSTLVLTPIGDLSETGAFVVMEGNFTFVGGKLIGTGNSMSGAVYSGIVSELPEGYEMVGSTTAGAAESACTDAAVFAEVYPGYGLYMPMIGETPAATFVIRPEKPPHNHEDVTGVLTELTDWSQLETSGNYYLGNVIPEVWGDIEIADGVEIYLCLNGKTLDLGSKYITNSGSLTICDCQSAQGSIISTHRVATIYNLGTLSVTGGIISNNGLFDGSACIINTNNGTLSFGGTAEISNTGEKKIDGINIKSGTVIISGGSIICAGSNTGISNDGTLIINDVELISQSTAIDNRGIAEIKGGHIEGQYGIFNNGEVTVSGGKIVSTGFSAIKSTGVGAKTTVSGGTIVGNEHGVMNDNNSVLTVEGGDISGSYSAVYGGGTVTIGGTAKLDGGQNGVLVMAIVHIKGGDIKGGYSAVRLESVAGVLYLSGAPTFTTTGGANQYEIYFMKDAIYAVDAGVEYSGDALRICAPFGADGDVIVYGVTEANKDSFSVVESNDYILKQNGSNLVLASPHTHAWSEDFTSNGTHHWHECENANCPITLDSEKDGYEAHATHDDDDSCLTAVKCPTCEYVFVEAKADHTYTYSEDGAVITETCSVEGCTVHSETATVTAPEGTLVYDGESNDATVEYSANWKGGELVISYKKDGDNAADTKNAGGYAASVTVGGVTATATYTVEAKDITNAVITLGEGLTYNGTAQTQTVVSVKIDGLDVTYDISGNTGTDADSYELTVTGNGNFTGSAKKAWSISALDITDAVITLGEALTYNGTAQTQTVVSVKIDGLDVTYDISGNTGTDADSYELTVTGNGNFTGSAKKAWSIAALDIEDAVITLGEALIYNGNLQTQTVVSVKIDGLDVTYDISGNTGTDADSYELTVTGNGNFTGSAEKAWSIAALDITDAVITLGEGLTYNGNLQTQTVVSVKIDGLDVTYDISGNTGTDADSYELTVTGNGNFTGSAKKSWSIAALDITDAVITLGEALTYNGTAQTQTVVSVKINGLDVTYDISGNTATDVKLDGSYELTVMGTGNFTGSAKETWNIAPLDIEDAVITLGEALVYNGTAQTQTVVSVKINGLDVTYDISGNTATDVKLDGSYELTVMGTGNFTGSAKETWNIAPLDIENAVITLGGETLVYNGTTQTQMIASVVVDGLDVTYDVTGNTAINAGPYELTVTGKGNFKGSAKKAWLIDKAQQEAPSGVVGVGTSYTNTKDGRLIRVTPDMEYKLSTEDTYISIKGDKVTGLESGRYHVRYKEDANHYASDYVEVRVTKGGKRSTSVTLSSSLALDKVYDGNRVSIGADAYTYVGDGRIKITWYADEGGTKGAALSSAPFNAGTYYVGVSATEGTLFEATREVTKKFVISKASAVITVDTSDIVKTYGDVWSLPTATSNFGTPTANLTVSDMTNAGEYTLTFTVADADNYIGDTKSIKVIINKATYDMSGIGMEDKTVIYNGQTHSIVISGTLPNGVTVEYEGNGMTEAGVYTVTASFVYDTVNYNTIAPMSAVLTVNKADITDKVDDADDSKAPDVIVKNEGGFDPKVDIVITKVGDENTKKSELVGIFDKIGAVYDVTMRYDGVAVQPNGEITVKLLIPSELAGKDFRILHNHNGEFSEVEYTVEGAYAVFTVDKLSEFSFVYYEFPSWIVVVIAVVICGAAVAVGIVIFKKKKKNA